MAEVQLFTPVQKGDEHSSGRMRAFQAARTSEDMVGERGVDVAGEFRLHARTLHSGKPFEVKLGDSKGEVRGVAFSRQPMLGKRHGVTAEFEGSDAAEMMLVPTVGGFVGTMRFPDGKQFAVQPRDRVGGVHIAREIHALGEEECQTREVTQLQADLAQRERDGVTWGNMPIRRVVDVLYVYTPETVAAANNGHESKARLSVEKMNRALQNTPFGAMLNLRGVRVLSGVITSGMNADDVLNEVSRNEQVSRWKEETRADVVQVVSFWNESSRGIADLYPGEYSGVTPGGQDGDSDVHEFGHMIFGLLHNKENAGNLRPRHPSAYGWRNPGVERCVMSYASGRGEPRRLWFANATLGRGNAEAHALPAMEQTIEIVAGRRIHTNVQQVFVTHLPLIAR
jgi:hypothetical protein